MPLPPGTRLGPYRLESLLGAGGMGEVYRAEDARLHRTVAIKVLPRELATADRIERFESEARAASALNHPNILTIHDVGREGGTAYFAMEWVDGQTLRQLLHAGPVPLRRTIELARQIARGLAKAHAAGIVHRDLKPENVMITDDGLAKIVDFGLAKLVTSAASAAGSELATVTRPGSTQPGMVLGTAGYMSPEQASGRPVDYRSDQFALGLLIYELVTRTRPFQRETMAQTLAATIDEEPAPLDALNPEVPPQLASVVSRCLSKDPSERYHSTHDLALDLQSLSDGSASRTGAVASPVRRRGRVIAMAAAALVIAAAIPAVWMWRTAAPSAPAEAERPLLIVRPFRSLSADARDHFAAGMTEEIRGQLSQLSGVRLLSRTALDGYKDDLARGVRELGVRNLVDGSVRVEGSRVRVSAELVEASTQQTLWSSNYDRELADILTVQTEIAMAIAQSLRANLSKAERDRIGKRPTANLEAYRLYLEAQGASSLDRTRTLEAVELLRKALALDPAFAAAQARIAFRYMMMGYYDDPSYVDKGLAEAQAALRLDPDLPFAYFALGSGYGMKGLHAQARQAFLHALELDPNDTSAMANFSIEETNNGRPDEGAYWGRRMFLLSGQGGNAFYHLTVPLLSLRANREVRLLLEEGERRLPTFSRIQMLLGILDLMEGQTDRAVSRADTLAARQAQNEEVKFFRADLAYLLDAPDLERWVTPLMTNGAANNLWAAETSRMKLAYALARRGDTAQAAALAAAAERIARGKLDAGSESPMLRVELAAAAAMRKDQAGALDWLERAAEAGYLDYDFLQMDPIFRTYLGSVPRLTELIDRMKRDLDTRRENARQRGLLDLAPLLQRSK